MAVTVIGDDNLIPREVVCHRCRSILSYLPTDRKIGCTVVNRRHTKTYRYITCPVCIKSCAHAPAAAEVEVEE